jgi:hypothetical protein
VISAIGVAATGAHAGNARVGTPNVIVDAGKGTLKVPTYLYTGLVRFDLEDSAQPGSLSIAGTMRHLAGATARLRARGLVLKGAKAGSYRLLTCRYAEVLPREFVCYSR